MKHIDYVLIGCAVWLTVEFILAVVGIVIGASSYDMGCVSTAIAILCGVVVACTLMIIDTIKSLKR